MPDHTWSDPKPSKRSRHADPIDNVPALFETYQASGGVVPLGVLVAEVEALQQAATRLEAGAEGCSAQLAQLKERGKLDLTNDRREKLEAAQERLQQEMAAARASEQELRGRYGRFRDAGVARFVPLLLQTVAKYDAAFEGSIDDDAEEALARVAATCGPVNAKGRTLRQPLPSATPKEDLATLMQLMGLAIQAGPKLKQLALDAIAGRDGCEVVVAPKPTKGLARALQKCQEEYEGDYTRILDYARITIVCDHLPVLASILEWLLAPSRAPRFVGVRTKDRLSREWDAEMSGGNRDVMVNGWLSLGGGRKLIVEVQLHLRVLYELKSDLHVLYAGARVLGAMEEATTKHEGVLSDQLITRVASGVVRQVHCPFSPMDTSQREQLAAAMKREPCALLELDLAFCESDGGAAFEGWTISRVLEPSTGTLACRRLRYLALNYTGLSGEIPSAIAQCHALQDLRLSGNVLTGPVPEWLGELRALRHLGLHYCKLTGQIPPSLGQCSRLEKLYLSDNMLSGEVPVEALSKLRSLQTLRLGTAPEEERQQVPESIVAYLEAHGVWYPEGGNPQLSITAAGLAAIKAAMQPNCVFWWPALVG